MKNGSVKNVLIVGVGGQGIILASNILTEAALAAGLDAKKSEIHGMSQRGGSVFSHVRFGDKIHSPVIPFGETDILVSLEEMETLRWLPFLHRDTQLIISKTRILPPMAEAYPEGIQASLEKEFANVHLLDSEQIAKDIGNRKSGNTVLLGALSAYLDFDEAIWQATIEKMVPEGTFDNNWAAFQEGARQEKEAGG